MSPANEPDKPMTEKPEGASRSRDNGFSTGDAGPSTQPHEFTKSSEQTRQDTERAMRSALMDCYNG
jgi:hypothetical protein